MIKSIKCYRLRKMSMKSVYWIVSRKLLVIMVRVVLVKWLRLKWIEGWVGDKVMEKLCEDVFL